MIKIRQITIRNFRSIENVTLNFHLEPKHRLLSFVGQNNAGKSNILYGIHILFQHHPPYLELQDFHNHDLNSTITFEARFYEPLIYKPFITSDIQTEIFGIRRERKVAVKGKQKGQIIWIHSCLNISGDVLMAPDSRGGKGIKPHFSHMFEIPSEVWQNIQCIFVPTDRDMEQHAPDRKRGLLFRGLERIDSSFNDPRNEQHYRGKTVPRSDLFRKRVPALTNLLKTHEFNNFVSNMRTTLKIFFEGDLDVTFDGLSSLSCYQALDLAFYQDKLRVLPDRMGNGAKLVLFLGILFAYHRLACQDAIFIIEEPELHLHPHRQRVFYKFILEHLAKTNLVFISTHSPEFVDLENYQHICRVLREPSTKTATIDGQHDRTIIKHLRRTVDQSLRTCFFSSAVILVEGQSDYKALPIYSERLDIRLESHNISLVFAGGKAGIRTLAIMLRSLRIPVVVLFDKDTQDERKNMEIKNLCPGDHHYATFMNNRDLEDEIRRANSISREEWKKIYERLPGKGKINRAMLMAEDTNMPIPGKIKKTIKKAIKLSTFGSK